MSRRSFSKKDRARIFNAQEIAALKATISYDPETGRLAWIVPPRYSTAKTGDEVGSLSQGYRRVRFNGKNRLCHRIAWVLYYGFDAPDFIDHINGERSDNRIDNLRVVTKAENAKNRSAYRGKSLPKGVTFHPSTGKYRARIRCDGTLHSLGLFDTPDEAYARYREAAAEFFAHLARDCANAV